MLIVFALFVGFIYTSENQKAQDLAGMLFIFLVDYFSVWSEVYLIIPR